jgi:hypothetical protein
MMGYIAQLVYDIRNDDIEAQRAEKQIDKLTYRLFNISPEEQQTIANYLQFTSSE